jgi:hypothetical protein
MKFKVLEIGEIVTKQGKNKPYQVFELSYKDLDYDKVNTRQIMSFTPVFVGLSKAGPGSIFTVDVEKDKNGYNQWTNLAEAGFAAPEKAADEATGAKVAGRPATAARSSYETAEERAAKQILIVRQSSVAQAVALICAAGTKADTPDVDKVFDIADRIVAYVFDTQEEIQKELDERVE